MECGHPLRDGPCVMDEFHKGRHTTVAFYCDGCGKMRRGQPRIADEHVAFCFVCYILTKDEPERFYE